MWNTVIFFKATALDAAVLAGIGVLVSAWIWFVLEAVKRAANLKPPHRWPRRLAFSISAVVIGIVITWFGLPVALAGVGAGWPQDLERELNALSVAGGLTAGLGAQVAHEQARAALEAIFGWVLQRIGGSDDGDNA